MQKVLKNGKKHRTILGIGVVLVFIIVARAVRGRTASSEGDLTAPLKKGKIVESVYGIGIVSSSKSFSFKQGVASTVRKLLVKEGDQVRGGQILLNLDGMVEVRAPFAGTVTYLPVKVGETVFAQATVFTLVDLKNRYVTVSLEQRGALRVKQGQSVRVSIDSMRDQVFEGVVESIYSNDGNFLVRIGMRDLAQQILPGMSADVAIGVSEHNDALLIPIAALDSDQVYVKKESGNSIGVIVKVGIVDGAFAEIKEGDLHEGDVLIIRKKVAL